jgi:hypothetical protein
LHCALGRGGVVVGRRHLVQLVIPAVAAIAEVLTLKAPSQHLGEDVRLAPKVVSVLVLVIALVELHHRLKQIGRM